MLFSPPSDQNREARTRLASLNVPSDLTVHVFPVEEELEATPTYISNASQDSKREYPWGCPGRLTVDGAS